MQTANSPEITFFLQPFLSHIKIGPIRAVVHMEIGGKTTIYGIFTFSTNHF